MSKEICADCGGSGKKHGKEKGKPCMTCMGTAYLPLSYQNHFLQLLHKEPNIIWGGIAAFVFVFIASAFTFEYSFFTGVSEFKEELLKIGYALYGLAGSALIVALFGRLYNLLMKTYTNKFSSGLLALLCIAIWAGPIYFIHTLCVL